MAQEYASYQKEELAQLCAQLTAEYDAVCQRGLKLDMSRGKPGKEQLDITQDMLCVMTEYCDCRTEGGFDCRNYGLLDGTPEAKQLFAEILEVPANNIFVGGNSSLNLMYDAIVRAMLYGVCGEKPWSKCDKVKFLCPAPGYDRHFAICESLGIEMIPIEMHADGPDMDQIEALIANDESVKGIWCVPKYSNPQGIVYSDEVVRRFANLSPKAKDFRIFWDHAYVVHGFRSDAVAQANIFEELKKNGKEDMVYLFASTSKISFPGAGVAVVAASDRNMAQIKAITGVQTIGFDKLNQMRHVKYFKNAQGVTEKMRQHAAIVAPKFDIVLNTLQKQLGSLGIADWTNPQGGYFISLETMDGCARTVYELAKKAGVVITPAGAAFPYGRDPKDSNLRLAPTFPSNADLQQAIDVLCLCIKKAAADKLLSQMA